jgi:hypothetical protein
VVQSLRPLRAHAHHHKTLDGRRVTPLMSGRRRQRGLMVSAPQGHDHFVVYGDVLGFRDLVLTHQSVQAETLTYRRQNSRLMAASLEHGNPLQKRLRNFHAKVDDVTFNTSWPAEVSVMVFSDSLFVATTDGRSCMDFCQRLLRECITAEIPLRMGVGFGTFVTNSFAFESVPMAKVVTTQFLGTGVVYAHDAEKTLKGLRIALHPSAVMALEDRKERNDRRLVLTADQRTEHASHEWNFLPSESGPGRTMRILREDLRRHVKAMQSASSEDPAVQLHYQRTLSAINQMTFQMHEEWLSSSL